MSLVSGSSGQFAAAPAAEKGNGAPPASFQGKLGQQYFDTTSIPWVEYIYNGSSWATAGASPATTTTYGSVLLTDNSEPVATKVYADNLAIAGAPVATTLVEGISYLATDAMAVTPATVVNPNTVLIPSNLTAVFAAPPAIGSGTPAAGSFTTLAASGLASLSGSATITTGATALNLASDASTGAVNIGTGAGARVTAERMFKDFLNK